jgi:transcriptional regulator with GAF, ATPase, and Fis domain/AmiR/NasT family two-component response regulator
MGTTILIVEDEFIVADELSCMLQEAGYVILGVAKSVEQALTQLKLKRPDLVLLDIYLKGERTGLELAVVLSKENIPFVYLSANSNASVLEAAKATRPHGFLAKPYRQKDVLVALDIAGYKHYYNLELIKKQERLLGDILMTIMDVQGSAYEKLLLVVKAFRPYIPFEYVHFDLDVENADLSSVYSFRRTGYNEYEFNTGWQIMEKFGLEYQQYNCWRIKNAANSEVKMENGPEFEESCERMPFLKVLKETFNVHARIVAPLTSEGRKHMEVRFYSGERESYTAEHLELMHPLRSLLSVVLDNIRKPKKSEQLRNVPNSSIETAGQREVAIDGIIGNSPKLLAALDLAAQVAPFDVSALILGETGVGKEGLAKAIHQLSDRRKNPLIKVNCAAIPATLIESELFGHEKGAFTGAFERRIGKFEQAHGGTIFLDEMGELPLDSQVKLLRVLQEKEFERVGGKTTIKVNVRVIAATNRNLHKDVIAGRFRMDLYYRINVFPIVIAPLRERKEDIPLLARHFLQQHAKRSGSEPKHLTSKVLQQLTCYSWPGNVRELQHVIERNIVLNRSPVISAIELPGEELPEEEVSVSPERFLSIAEVDRAHILTVLKKCNGKVSGKGGAAEVLNMPATTLNSKMKKLGISWKFTAPENI